MVTAVVESNGDTNIRRRMLETVSYDCDGADNEFSEELAALMPALRRCFLDLEEEEGNLNFMGVSKAYANNRARDEITSNGELGYRFTTNYADDDEENIIFSNGCTRRIDTCRPLGSTNLSATRKIVVPPSCASEGGQKKIVVSPSLIAMDDGGDFTVRCCEETLKGPLSNGVTSCIEDEVHIHKVEEAQWDDVDSSRRQFGCSVPCDKNKSRKNQISKSKFGSPARAGNAGQVPKEYQKVAEDANDGASSSEAELLHRKAHGRSLGEETVTTIPVKNLEEMTADDAQLLTQQLEETIASEVPLSCDANRGVASNGCLTKKEESHKHEKPQPKSERVRRKSVQRRMSLEDSGSLWKNGRRCSQRRHLRPLEWWRGEKLLYGRVHTSLSTVIGIKHSSPGKYSRGIRDPFVIESFVPAKYNELVRMAAI